MLNASVKHLRNPLHSDRPYATSNRMASAGHPLGQIQWSEVLKNFIGKGTFGQLRQVYLTLSAALTSPPRSSSSLTTSIDLLGDNTTSNSGVRPSYERCLVSRLLDIPSTRRTTSLACKPAPLSIKSEKTSGSPLFMASQWSGVRLFCSRNTPS